MADLKTVCDYLTPSEILAQLEYIIEWRERKRSKKNQREMYRREAIFHFRMFWKMLFNYFKGV